MVSPFVGSEFWGSQFGLESFSEFKAVADPLLANPPIPSWAGGSLANDVFLLSVYNDPAQPAGIYVAARLAGDSFGSSRSIGKAVAAALPTSQPNYPGNTNMPTLIIPNSFQVSIHMRAGGHDIFNVIGVYNPSGTSAAAAAAVKTAWEATGGPLKLLLPLVTMVNYRAVDLSSAFGDIADVASTTAGSSTQTQFATRGAAALVTWNGSQRSRSTRGRLYFGPISEGNIQADGATLTAVDQAAMITAFNQFRTQLSAAGYGLVVLSRVLSQAFPITSVNVEPVIATQRRRIR